MLVRVRRLLGKSEALRHTRVSNDLQSRFGRPCRSCKSSPGPTPWPRLTRFRAQQASPKAGRCIHTAQELHLLISIYREQGYKEEALQILDSANLGVRSTVAKGTWSMVRDKLELLEESELWPQLWDFCKTTLDEARGEDHANGNARQPNPPHGDDWTVWKCLVTACNEMDMEE